jgi:hypothetical protein
LFEVQDFTFSISSTGLTGTLYGTCTGIGKVANNFFGVDIFVGYFVVDFEGVYL